MKLDILYILLILLSTYGLDRSIGALRTVRTVRTCLAWTCPDFVNIKKRERVFKNMTSTFLKIKIESLLTLHEKLKIN